MPKPMDPTSQGFLIAESRSTPLHVGGLQLFDLPEDAGPTWVSDFYDQALSVEKVAPLYRKRPRRSLTTAGTWTWVDDEMFDLEYHVRHSALPRPGRIRELLELCGRLHGTRLALERPLWEMHIIEGLADGRLAVYTKLHHALVDGVAAMRLLQASLSTDPEVRDIPPPWAVQDNRSRGPSTADLGNRLTEIPADAARAALAISAEAAGLPAALLRTMNRGLRDETAPLSLYAPRSILNQRITGARRFAAQDWPVERLRAVGKASGTTINDVVLAMCSGALRHYLLDLDALPEHPIVAMVPVSLKLDEVDVASAAGGNSVGLMMVGLSTDRPDAGDRLQAISDSVRQGKEAMASMSQMQLVAMSALGISPLVLQSVLRLQGVARPPFNLVISNVPGPKKKLYLNGAGLSGMYPLSVPYHGMALNITCTSYAGTMGFGLTGCRRTAPSLQRLLTYLDDELNALERAAGVG